MIYQTTIRSLLAASLLLTAAFAEAAQYDVDADHSNVGFRIRHLVGKVSGKFTKYKGSFDWDGKDIKTWKANATIEASSIDTGNTKRDEHLKSPDFFDAAKFATLTFTSKEISDVSGNTAKLHGTLTMHGVTKEVVLNLEVTAPSPDAQKKMHSGASLTGKVNRQDFGIKFNKTLDTGGLMLGDDVELQIDLEGVQK